jgi:UDP-N-acetylmuramate dehydrogenase
MLQWEENIDLTPYNSFGMQVFAKYFIPFQSVEDLSLLEIPQNANWLIIGGGSNILFKNNFDGCVLLNQIKGIEKVGEDDDFIYLKVGGGEQWHDFVEYCITNNYGGVENLALIPGSVGAAPIQNIGAYGVELKDVLFELEAYNWKDKQLHTFSVDQCKFGYRDSVFKNECKGDYVICTVIFRLNKVPVFQTQYGAIEKELEAMGVKDLSIRAIADAVINIRRSKLPDPKVIGNAGSFFKNPTISEVQFEILKEQYPEIVGYYVGGRIKLAAGWLIEKAGWKGYRRGDVGVHPKQALVLVNYGNANGDDIFQLSEEVINSIVLKFNIFLEREVNII